MFEQIKGLENTYLVSIYTICLLKSADTSDHLFFGESLKLDSVWGHTVKFQCCTQFADVGDGILFVDGGVQRCTVKERRRQRI